MRKLLALLGCFVLTAAIPVDPAPSPLPPAALAVAAEPAGRWNGPIRLPWYNQEGQPLGCPGAGAYKRWKHSVAVRQSDPRFECGDRIELRYHNQAVKATVMDHMSEAAPAWVVFDAAAILNCRLLLAPSRRTSKPKGYVSGCSTLSGVKWRKIG